MVIAFTRIPHNPSLGLVKEDEYRPAIFRMEGAGLRIPCYFRYVEMVREGGRSGGESIEYEDFD